MMRLKDAASAAELLSRQNQIRIVTHRNPDGDTLGSAAALCHALRRMGKEAWMVSNPQITERYTPYVEAYLAPEGTPFSYTVFVDVSSEDMVLRDFAGKADLCIDHHPTNPLYAENNLVRPECAASGMIIYEIICELLGDADAEEATLLYIALTTDTGCFRHANTDDAAFETAARLFRCGAKTREVTVNFFEKASAARIRLEAAIYSEMETMFSGRVVVALLTLRMLEESGATENDLDDIANLATRVESEELAITIRETPEHGSKLSIRGEHAAEIALVFGGGGHALAAGCRISAEPEQAKKQVLDVVARYFA